jgi:hypothetical protein
MGIHKEKRKVTDKCKGKNCVKRRNGTANRGTTDVKFSMRGIMMMTLALP